MYYNITHSLISQEPDTAAQKFAQFRKFTSDYAQFTSIYLSF